MCEAEPVETEMKIQGCEACGECERCDDRVGWWSDHVDECAREQPSPGAAQIDAAARRGDRNRPLSGVDRRVDTSPPLRGNGRLTVASRAHSNPVGGDR